MEFAILPEFDEKFKLKLFHFLEVHMKSNQSKMKKSTSKASLVPAGGGVWVQKNSSRPVPNNKGLSYFKWSMETTMVLLNECLSKEVWAKEYGDLTI